MTKTNYKLIAKKRLANLEKEYEELKIKNNDEYYEDDNYICDISDLEHLLEYNGDYCKSITKQNISFDIVIIDGRDRVNCLINSINYLNKEGVIIFDNSDREYYEEGFKFLNKNGFKRLEFQGHGPICINFWETSIFYREKNCLGI